MAEALRVLVIEDSDVDYRLLTRQLKQAGFDIASTCVETEHKLEQALDTSTWDLILSDEKMPHLSAIGALEILHRRQLDIPFIVVSGTIGEEKAVELMRAGAHDFFVKGHTARLSSAIRRELRQAIHRHERRAARIALQTRAQQQAAVAAFGTRALVSTELQDLLEEAVQTVTTVLDVGLVQILELQPDATTLMIRAAGGSLTERAASVVTSAAPRTQAGYTLETAAPVVVYDYATEERFTRPPGTEALGLVSAISIVIQDGGLPFGILCLFSITPRAFSDDDVHFCESIANILSYAQRNVTLLQAEIRARAAAERANQLKSQFLAMISHELRTPLASIKGFLSSLLASDVTWDTATQQEFLTIADKESDKLIDLVEQLLNVSQLQAGTLAIYPKPQALDEIVQSIMPQLLILTAQHQLTITLPADLPRVMSDQRRIEQVIINLVQNAAKYSPQGSRIEIAAHAVNQMVQVSVRDEGEGIAPADRDAVFEVFLQLERNRRRSGGAGLGLAICKGILEAHRGKIWIEDNAPKGAIVAFTLPIASP